MRAAAETVEVPRPTIGERLRQARESQGLDLAEVAERLHLKRATVIDLEEENFDRLPARVFVRGYYRNYARLLGLPEEPLLQAFDDRCPEGEECAGAPPVVAQGVRREIRSNHGLVRLVTWLVAISVVAAVGLWWRDQAKRTQAPVAEPVAEASGTVESGRAAEQDGASPPSEPAAAAQVAAPPLVEPVEPTREPAPSATAATEVEPAATEPEAPSPPVVELRFTQDSWVDVRGAEGSFKLVGTRRAGEAIRLEGRPPYRFILGNAHGVEVRVNGEPYDFSSRTRRNVARFTLNP